MGRMTDGVQTAMAAEHLLHGHTGTLAEARARLGHLTATKDELWDAVAYLACQVWAYRSKSDEDLRLAFSQIAGIVHAEERRMNNRREEAPGGNQ